jgi:hypothetical protein
MNQKTMVQTKDEYFIKTNFNGHKIHLTYSRLKIPNVCLKELNVHIETLKIFMLI